MWARYLVLSGGGPHGVITVGAIQYLELMHPGHRFHGVGGTSIGSFLAALHCAGLTGVEMEKIIRVTLPEVEDKILRPSSRLERHALVQANPLVRLLKEHLRNKFGSEDVTFQEIARQGSPDLRVCCMCLNTATVQVFSVAETPLVPVALAVEASMAVPFLFPAVEVHKNLLYADGGCIMNCPMQMFQDPDRTLGLWLRSPPSSVPTAKIHASIIQYASQVAKAFYYSQDEALLQSSSICNIMQLSTDGFSVLGRGDLDTKLARGATLAFLHTQRRVQGPLPLASLFTWMLRQCQRKRLNGAQENPVY